jgi:hypothetical protein
MTRKIATDQVPIWRAPRPECDPYGERWGAGPAATPYNRPGSIASDPTSAPPTRQRARPLQGPAVPPAAEEEAALREQREQGWDSEGGAASPRSR